ncbi:methyltransferase family protein [Sulfuriflexus mobilis]|uniref:methyltransferase family protein n=1 Tax=Sulfuriflexus mobilis TaxID=1811807 RepID=UPI000F82991D|nr:isoprenylcysteine carboxylmethyltransferase family protein [Sulfuriflexus mobilis]
MALNEDKNGASVKLPPPVVFILFILIAYGIHYYFLAVEISSMSFLFYIGSFFVTLGLTTLLVATVSFKRAQTNIKPWKPTTKIISTGIFSYSRNPIYLAFCIVTIGIGLIVNNLWITLSFIPSISVIYFTAIKKEESYLEKKFGQDYLAYKEKVRRWF